ncbi:MAG: PCP reductase family protein, partial [Planctomycetota bacterium]
LAATGNQMDEDAWCNYVPGKSGNEVIQLATSETFGVEEQCLLPWDAGAKNLLHQIPSFARGMVIKNIEQFAARNNYREITQEVMRVAREEMMTNKKTAFSRKSNEPAHTPVSGSKDELPQAEEIPWTEEARKRVEHAPDFVRPGIYKLMQKKARLYGYKEITSKFLSEIRDESMQRASKRIKHIGFDELRMEAWDKAKEKLKNVRKQEVIEKIKTFLGERTEKNEGIITKFQAYLDGVAASGNEKSLSLVWTEDAKQRIEKAPIFVRGRAKKAIEAFAVQQGCKEITGDLINQYMKNIPSFVSNKFR